MCMAGTSSSRLNPLVKHEICCMHSMFFLLSLSLDYEFDRMFTGA